MPLANEVLSAGWHRYAFGGDGLAVGIYLVRLEAGSYTSTLRMLRVK